MRDFPHTVSDTHGHKYLFTRLVLECRNVCVCKYMKLRMVHFLRNNVLECWSVGMCVFVRFCVCTRRAAVPYCLCGGRLCYNQIILKCCRIGFVKECEALQIGVNASALRPLQNAVDPELTGDGYQGGGREE